MKLFYLNDERKEITVRIQDATWDYTYKTDNAKNFHRLGPAEMREFDVQIPDGKVLWIKKWPDIVMISYCDPSALAQPDEQLPSSGAV
jgi:hypothetical protein